MPENFYDLLGVDEDATEEELKRAYRQRAREYHPDVNADDRAGAQFKTVRRAYDVLRDGTERSKYDRLGHETYVRKHMQGLPKESSSSGSSSSRSSSASQTSTWSSSSSSQSSRSSTSTSRSSTGTGSRSGSANSTRWNGSTGSRGTRQRTQRTQRTQQTTSSRSQRSNTSRTTTASGPQYTYPEREQPSSSRDRLRNRWLVVASAFALYLGGLVQFALAAQPALTDLVATLPVDPVGTLTATGGFGTPAAFVGTAVATATTAPSAALLFPVGAVVLPLALAWTVGSFGHGSAWLYVVATLGPLVGLVAGFSVSAVPTAVDLLAFALLPVVAVLVFLGDVGRYLFATR